MEHLGYVLFCFGFVFGSFDPPNRRGLTLFFAGFWFGDPMILRDVFFCVFLCVSIVFCLIWSLVVVVLHIVSFCVALGLPSFVFLCAVGCSFDGGLQEHFPNKNSHFRSASKHSTRLPTAFRSKKHCASIHQLL